MSFEFKDFGFYLIDEPYLKYLHKKGLSDPPAVVYHHKLRTAAVHAVKQDALLFFSSNHSDVQLNAADWPPLCISKNWNIPHLGELSVNNNEIIPQDCIIYARVGELSDAHGMLHLVSAGMPGAGIITSAWNG